MEMHMRKPLFATLAATVLLAGCATESAYNRDRASNDRSGIAGYESRYDGVPSSVSPWNSPRGTWREPASDSSDKSSRKQMP
jgi:nitrous oxide reductase accessory protein NosL